MSAVAWIRGQCLNALGRFTEAQAVAADATVLASPTFWPELEGVRLGALWALGQVDEAASGYDDLVAAAARSGVAQHQWGHLQAAAGGFAWLGELERARGFLASLRALPSSDADETWRYLALSMAEASVAVADGRDDDAAAIARHSRENQTVTTAGYMTGRALTVAVRARAGVARRAGRGRRRPLPADPPSCAGRWSAGASSTSRPLPASGPTTPDGPARSCRCRGSPTSRSPARPPATRWGRGGARRRRRHRPVARGRWPARRIPRSSRPRGRWCSWCDDRPPSGSGCCGSPWRSTGPGPRPSSSTPPTARRCGSRP